MALAVKAPAPKTDAQKEALADQILLHQVADRATRTLLEELLDRVAALRFNADGQLKK